MSDHTTLHDTLKIFDKAFTKDSSTGRKPIGIRLDENADEEGNIHFYTLGKNHTTNCKSDACDAFFARDYAEFDDFEKHGKPTGLIMVPEKFVPDCPTIFDAYLTQNAMQSLEERKDKNQMKGALTRHVGDRTEYYLYEGLENHFKDYNALVIRGLKMDDLESGKKQEIDFLVVDYDHQCIWNIECKKKLEYNVAHGKEESSAIKSKKQLQIIRNLLSNWFTNELKGNWHYISALFCEEMEDQFWKCDHCSKFILVGKDDISLKLRQIEEKIKLSKKYPDDFAKLAKYLLFCYPTTELPVRGNLVSSIRNTILEQQGKAKNFGKTPYGGIENIILHCFPTREQRSILHNPKLIILGCWGSGKTWFLNVEAMRLSSSKKPVMFIVLRSSNTCETDKPPKSLLVMDLEEKFKRRHKLVKVIEKVIKDGIDNNLRELTQEFDHIMIDEGFADFDTLSPETQKEFSELFESKSQVWLTLSNFHNLWSKINPYESIDRKVKKMHPGFEVAKLSMPLRLSMNNAQELKDQYIKVGRVSSMTLNERLIMESKLPVDMVKGLSVKRVGFGAYGSLISNLRNALKHINPSNTGILLVIDDRLNEPKNKSISNLIECDCKIRVLYLALVVSLQLLGRKKPLFHCLQYSSKEEDIKNWMAGERDRDLVASLDVMRGFECEIIVDLSGQIEITSRVLCQLIKVYHNWYLTAMNFQDHLLRKQHNCENVLEEPLQSGLDPMIAESLEQSIGELYLPEQFEISSTLREPQRYIQSQENPILEVLADQVNNDTTSKLHGLTGTILLNRILDGLESGSIKWPIENTFIDQETWSEKMFYDHSFYSLLCKDVDEWKKYEQLLIYLASQLLQKKIVTIRFPFNNDSTNMEFTADSITTLDEHLYLFSCDFAMEDSCHISIVKKGRTVRSRRKWLRSLLPF